ASTGGGPRPTSTACPRASRAARRARCCGPCGARPEVRPGSRPRKRSGIEKQRRRRSPSVARMTLFVHSTFLPADDPDASLAFYRDVLGFEVRNDVGQGSMRWITIGSPEQPDVSIVLHPPAVDPG